MLVHKLTWTFFSKRAFQNQLKLWNFQKRHIPAAKRPEVVAAVEQLWKEHVAPKEMLRILNEERGFEVGARELARLRADNKWFIRARNGTEEKEAASSAVGAGDKEKDAVDDGGSTDEEEMIAAIDASLNCAATLASASLASSSLPPATSTTTEDLAQAPLHPTSTGAPSQQQQSATTKLTLAEVRKARRRIHHPTTGKFPSEMKLEDCKKVLAISEPTYQAIRTAFLAICETSNIQRKKGCTIWAEAKLRLIDSVPALKAIFEQPMPANEKERKELAVDLICQDRTKNLRRNATRMELRDAKKLLCLDPAGVTRVQAALVKKLKADGFSTKTEAGEQHWKELRDAWVKEEGLGGNGEHGDKACDVICADVMKRMNDKRALKRKEKGAAKPHDGQKAGEDDEDEAMGDGEKEVAVGSPAPMNGFAGAVESGSSAGYGYDAFPATYTPYSMDPYATAQNFYTTTTSSNSHSSAATPHRYALAAASNPYTPSHTTTTTTDPASEYPEIDPALFYGS
ncbi:hypothetical protein MMC30_003126 [Trapelia coarctata]|nr:hypothetical protein [Trapelia coarctata]